MDTLTPKERSERMRRVRGKNTAPEMIVRRLVHGLGYRFRLHDRRLPGRPDLVFAGRRKVIFVHGCFWHRHRRCRLATTPKTNVEFWTTKFQENVSRDSTIRRQLRAAGWNSLVIWQCELHNPEVLVERIRTFLEDEKTQSKSQY